MPAVVAHVLANCASSPNRFGCHLAAGRQVGDRQAACTLDAGLDSTAERLPAQCNPGRASAPCTTPARPAWGTSPVRKAGAPTQRQAEIVMHCQADPQSHRSDPAATWILSPMTLPGYVSIICKRPSQVCCPGHRQSAMMPAMQQAELETYLSTRRARNPGYWHSQSAWRHGRTRWR